MTSKCECPNNLLKATGQSQFFFAYCIFRQFPDAKCNLIRTIQSNLPNLISVKIYRTFSEIRLKKYGVTIVKLLSEKKYLEIKICRYIVV